MAKPAVTRHRLTVNLNRPGKTALDHLRAQTGLNTTHIINRALTLYDLVDQKSADGWGLAFVRTVDGQTATELVKIL